MFKLVTSITDPVRKGKRQLGHYLYRILIVTAIRSKPNSFVNKVVLFSTGSDRMPLFANQ